MLEHMVNEGGHADEHIGLDLLDEAKIPVGAHHFAATGAESEHAKLRRSIVPSNL